VQLHELLFILSTPEGWKAEFAWLADPCPGQFTHKMVSRQPQIGHMAEKVCWPLSHAANQATNWGLTALLAQ